MIDLVRQREACAAVEELGRRVHASADDHEHLFVPYPMWHSNMAPLTAMYMADSLGLTIVDTGEVLDAARFGGYHTRERSTWKFRQPGQSGEETALADSALPWLDPIGMRLVESISGLSEVATTAMVARSTLRDKSYSCYYPSEESFCMRCDICFKKLLLRHIADDQEVPVELFEHFLAIPHLAAIFRRPYFDWHHVWYYLFQRIRCNHWFAKELHRQARVGPDLSFLEKWYPGSYQTMPEDYRDRIVEEIGRWVSPMTPAEVEAMEGIDVPPLCAPTRSPTAAVKQTSAPVALLEMLRTVLTLGPAPVWQEFELAELNLDPGGTRVLVVLRHADATVERVVLAVERAPKHPTRCYATVGGLNVSYLSSLGADDTVPRVAADALVRRLREAIQG